ncbi:MAG: carbon-nitrogen hydrolase family protein [Planctomycetes bacterium]|nr:carbon-nitrogen hydrolase family protein [Planctomycetota bacterium]
MTLIAVMFACLLLGGIAFAAGQAGGGNLVEWDASSATGGWETWAPRDEIAPEMKAGESTLLMSGRGLKYCSGAWRRKVTGLSQGEALDFRAVCRVSPDVSVLESIVVRLAWSGEDLRVDVTPDYARGFKQIGEGTWEITHQFIVPLGVEGANLELHLRWAPNAKVTWEDVSLTKGVKKPHRKVRVATIYWRNKQTTTIANNLKHFLALVDEAGKMDPDVILLTEYFKTIGAGDERAKFPEEVPGGPLFHTMAEKAKKYDTYIIYGDMVREEPYLSNAAVIVGRDGSLAGMYRKVQLTVGGSLGTRPGDSLPVFDLDFGRIGCLICHDTTFPDPARVLGVKGAEIVFVPIWGGETETMCVRAWENSYWWVVAGFDLPSMIINPRGKICASTWKDHGTGVAFYEIDLDKQFRQDYLGDWKNAVWKQRRPALYEDLSREMP